MLPSPMWRKKKEDIDIGTVAKPRLVGGRGRCNRGL